MKHRKLVSAGCAAMTMLALAGCSSGTKASTSASSPHLSGTPIKIGIISPETNPATGISTPDSRAGAQARVDAVNAAGGIKGSPLKLITCDDENDPNTSTTCAREMVSDHVVAVIGAANATDAEITPVLSAAKIPVIGAIAETSAVSSSPFAFCFDAGVAGDFESGPLMLAQQGAKVVSMLVPGGVPGTAPATQAFDAGVTASGAKNGGVVTFTSGQTQFDSEVAKATGGGADGVFAYADGQTISELVNTLRQQKPNVMFATLTTNFDAQSIRTLGSTADGVLAVGLGQPATASVPGIKMFNADMDKYADSSVDRTDFAINAWASVWLFQRLAASLTSITSSSVLAGMKTLVNFDMGGIFPPLTTTKPAVPSPQLSCVYNATVVYEKVVGGKLEPLVPGKFFNAFTGQPAS